MRGDNYLSITDLIKKAAFSTSEQAAIGYVMEKKYEVKDMTLKELARRSHTSPATFVRAAKKLGFSGWNDFKDRFLEEVAYFDSQFDITDLNVPFNQNDSVIAIANKVTKIKEDTLKDTLSLLNYKTLNKAVKMLNDAHEIDVFASNVNILLAKEFQFKMNRLQKKVNLSELEGEHIYDVLNMGRDSVALVISYSGSSKKMAEIMDTIKIKERPVIVITGLTENILTQGADIVLNMSTREKLYSKVGQYSTDTSILHILDILYSAIFAKSFHSNMTHTIQTAQIANYRKATTRQMREE